MLPILALNPLPHEKLLDMCSSPGSKTTQAASKMNNTGLIIANDLKVGRIQILSSNIERCGVSNVIMTKKDGTSLCRRFKEKGIKFDKILVDAPCSGEGTIRSTPKTFLMWNLNTVKSLSRLQKALVSSALSVLNVGGEMIYSTCTHSPEEDEEIVDFILEKFKGKIKIETIKLPLTCRPGLTEWDGKKYNSNVEKSCRVYPQDNNTEGFFLAKFKLLEEID
jgi:NOL1/NOP2/sun family putative RNA methylase